MASESSSTDIVKRLRASVRMGAHHGDTMERLVCGKQMLEAAGEIERLRKRVAELEAREQRPDPLSQALNEGDGVYRP